MLVSGRKMPLSITIQRESSDGRESIFFERTANAKDGELIKIPPNQAAEIFGVSTDVVLRLLDSNYWVKQPPNRNPLLNDFHLLTLAQQLITPDPRLGLIEKGSRYLIKGAMPYSHKFTFIPEGSIGMRTMVLYTPSNNPPQV